MPNRLRLEPWTEADGQIELAATLESAAGSRRLWWRAPAVWRDSLTSWADPFVIGLLFNMMSAGEEVEVEAPVSASLLANLESFMDIWHAWAPTAYRPLRIFSREEAEAPEPLQPAQLVMPFSCGVDSCFTALRHRRRLAGRATRDVVAGVTMFGFDIRAAQLNSRPMYESLARSAGAMLASLGMVHIEISTNFRDITPFWMHSHGTQLASGLSLFGRRFGGALVPDSVALNTLDTIWGSHPLTDPMQSSDHFRILPDGVGIPRWRKIAVLVDWPEAMSGLRVCFGEDGSVGNCGRCEKCIRTAIAFLMTGHTPPANLPTRVTPKMLRSIRLKHGIGIGFWKDLLSGIEANGKQGEPWASGVSNVLRRARRLRLAKQMKQPFLPLRNRIRQIFRGSAMSRKQRAVVKGT